MAVYRVEITFTNEAQTSFLAQEFDIDVPGTKGGNRRRRLQRFTYKDQTGKELPLYLTSAEVAGIVTTPHGE